MLLPYLLFFLLGLCCLFRLSYLFLVSNWEELTVDEILFHIFAPMGGANGHLVQLFITTALAPAILLWLSLSVFYYFFYHFGAWDAGESDAGRCKHFYSRYIQSVVPRS